MTRSKPVIGHVRPAPGVLAIPYEDNEAATGVVTDGIARVQRKLRVCQTENKALRADLEELAGMADEVLQADGSIEAVAVCRIIATLRQRWGLK